MKMQGDSIISALIGLVGAVSNNGKTEKTDSVIREAFLCLTDAGSEEEIRGGKGLLDLRRRVFEEAAGTRYGAGVADDA